MLYLGNEIFYRKLTFKPFPILYLLIQPYTALLQTPYTALTKIDNTYDQSKFVLSIS